VTFKLFYPHEISQYAKKTGVSYKTAFRWWKAGKLNAYQLETGIVIVREPAQPQEAMSVALYAASRGYQVTKTAVN
jgi:putative resolvase